MNRRETALKIKREHFSLARSNLDFVKFLKKHTQDEADAKAKELGLPESVNAKEYFEILKLISSQFVFDKLYDYERSKHYAKLALAEREKWEQQGDKYDPDKAPEWVRDMVRVSLSVVNSGASDRLCKGVENITSSAGYQVCRLLKVEGDTKVVGFVDQINKNLGIDQQVARSRRVVENNAEAPGLG